MQGALLLRCAKVPFVARGTKAPVAQGRPSAEGIGRAPAESNLQAISQIPRLNRIFFADATATIAGSLAGTSTVTSYIESSAGVAAGGRTGVTAIVTGILFFLSLFLAPIIGAIPNFATAPALILVGALALMLVVRLALAPVRAREIV